MPSTIPACINACSLFSDFLREGCVCLTRARLLLPVPCCAEQVPVVAITTTGGGTRSLTAMYGSLLGLQKLNLLDCISYIGGLSGTTWWEWPKQGPCVLCSTLLACAAPLVYTALSQAKAFLFSPQSTLCPPGAKKQNILSKRSITISKRSSTAFVTTLTQSMPDIFI